jgi:hypothetical protein
VGKGGDCLLAGSQNKNKLKVFKSNIPCRIIRTRPGDRYALIHSANGKTRRQECYAGDSFLSQSSGFIMTGADCKSIEIYNAKTGKRTIPLTAGEAPRSGF